MSDNGLYFVMMLKGLITGGFTALSKYDVISSNISGQQIILLINQNVLL